MVKETKKVEFDTTMEEGGKPFSLRDLLDGNVLTRKRL